MTPDSNGGSDLDPETVAELRRLARSRPRSGGEAVAKASALRTSERSRRGKRRVPPTPEGWYPHERGDPFSELDWVFLHDHPEILRRHWEARRGARAAGDSSVSCASGTSAGHRLPRPESIERKRAEEHVQGL